MGAKRVILELGTGNDLHGGDYTKAALRAVQDALHHSSLSLLRSLDIDPASMQVEVMIGVQQPGRVDAAAVKASLPHGQAPANKPIRPIWHRPISRRSARSNDSPITVKVSVRLLR